MRRLLTVVALSGGLALRSGTQARITGGGFGGGMLPDAKYTTLFAHVDSAR
jgi:hypothetical protein